MKKDESLGALSDAIFAESQKENLTYEEMHLKLLEEALNKRK